MIRNRHSSILLAIVLTTASCTRSFGQTTSLDGVWEFAPDSTGNLTIENVNRQANWRNATVPLSWQAQFPDLRDYQGVAWYRRTFEMPVLPAGAVAEIRFGAVDYVARVFVNGREVGTHEGGYTPFACVITDAVRKGKNELVVRIMDPTGREGGTEGINYRNIPHGKQSWYVQTSGIWQSVFLRIHREAFVDNIKITPSQNGSVSIGLDVRGQRTKGAGVVGLNIRDPLGKIVLTKQFPISPRQRHLDIQTAVPSPRSWSTSDPRLYTAIVTVGKNPPEEVRFGFRSFETKDGRFYLNNEPIFLMGALDQDFYPETMYTPPSEDVVRDEMVKAKEMGLNLLRCHIKAPDPVYFKVADEVGILVWYEIPNWDVLTPEAGSRAMRTLAEMLNRDWNHPSLVIVSLMNESWGIDLQDSAQRSWLKRSFNAAREMAPGRLIVDNSACWGNFHIKTDINDYHTYWSIPENRARFDETIKDYSRRPQWLFSPFGDAEQSGKEPLVLSEFGNWGLPRIPDRQPWWINRKFGNDVVVFPGGFPDRIRDFRYDGVFGSYDGLILASQIAQYGALKHEIETIRLSPALAGYVITEFTDINWESNGLLDMWRQKKYSARHLPDIQQQDVIIPLPAGLEYRAGDTIDIPVWLSHYGPANVDGAILKWESSISRTGGSSRVSSVDRGGVAPIARVKIPATPAAAGTLMDISFVLEERDGRTIARNFCSLFIGSGLPAIDSARQTLMYDPNAHLSGASSLFPKRFRVNEGLDPACPVVTSVLDSMMLARLDNGGTVICVVDSSTRFPSGFPVALARRDTGWYDGNWASNLNWVRTTLRKSGDAAVWEAFSTGRVDSSAFSGLVMTGIPPEYFDDVLAGMFVGWIRLNSAYTVQLNVGKGRLLLTTIPAAASVGNGPFATDLLRSVIGFVRSDSFHPRYGWDPNRAVSR